MRRERKKTSFIPCSDLQKKKKKKKIPVAPAKLKRGGSSNLLSASHNGAAGGGGWLRAALPFQLQNVTLRTGLTAVIVKPVPVLG